MNTSHRINYNSFRKAVASLVLGAVLLTNVAAPVAAQAGNTGWRGEYYANPSLSGGPALVRDDASLNFDWNNSVSPAPGLVPDDNFSVRWVRSADFEAGRYRFTVTTDDGMRLYVDGRLILDKWMLQGPTTYHVDVDLTAGTHHVWVEYFEAGGQAVAKVSWAKATEQPITEWRGEYYNNRWLSGSPSVVRNDSAVNFDWGGGSPHGAIPADNFSARWTRALYFDGGRYRFTTTTDDGVRLYVDDRLLIDQWRDMPPTTYAAEVDLTAGTHTVRMEYYEAGAGAVARLSWQKVTVPDQPITEWRGEYFNNPWLSGQPTFVRNDSNVHFNWGTGAPDARIPADNFSVRWTRDVFFQAGRYTFTTETDDGVRLYIDGNLVIDQWRDMAASRFSREIYLGEGTHNLRMEYYEKGGQASARLSWTGPVAVPSRGNLVTCLPPYPAYAWVKVYRLDGNGQWVDLNPRGYGAISASGQLKLDGLPVDYLRYGAAGHPYRVEVWRDNQLIRSTGNTTRGEPEFRLRADADNATPWGCPVN